MATIPLDTRGRRAGGGDIREQGEGEAEAEALSGGPRLYILLLFFFSAGVIFVSYLFCLAFLRCFSFSRNGEEKGDPTPTAGHRMALRGIVRFGYTRRRKTGSCHGPFGGPRVAG